MLEIYSIDFYRYFIDIILCFFFFVILLWLELYVSILEYDSYSVNAWNCVINVSEGLMRERVKIFKERVNL